MNRFKKTIKNSGFTLIELIVAVAVFSLVALSALSVFALGIKGQRKGLATQVVQENIHYALEMMAKEIRMSHIKDTTTQNALDIEAIKPTGKENVSYTLSSGRITRNGQAITSSAINVANLKFYANNIDDPPSLITITMILEGKGARPEEKVKMNLQTTLSSRDF